MREPRAVACDYDNGRVIDIGDGIAVFYFLFLDGSPPVEPGEAARRGGKG